MLPLYFSPLSDVWHSLSTTPLPLKLLQPLLGHCLRCSAVALAHTDKLDGHGPHAAHQLAAAAATALGFAAVHAHACAMGGRHSTVAAKGDACLDMAATSAVHAGGRLGQAMKVLLHWENGMQAPAAACCCKRQYLLHGLLATT